MSSDLLVQQLGQQPYETTFTAMQAFTAKRDAHTTDEIWFCQHPPVLTLGRHSKPEHILHNTNIPTIQTDRGGQVTYHGPGQLMIYLLIDLKRRSLGPKQFVCIIEQSIIDTVAQYDIDAERKAGAPGLYVQGAKIASVGLRIKHGCSYHGIALNVDMDLSPFQTINPCGYENLAMAQIADFTPAPKFLDLSQAFMAHWRAHCPPIKTS